MLIWFGVFFDPISIWMYYLTFWPLGVLWPSSLMAACVTSHLQVRGQGLVMHLYDDNWQEWVKASVCPSGDKRGNKGSYSGNGWKMRVEMKGGVICSSVELIDLFVFSQGEQVCWPPSQQKCWGIGWMAQWKCWQSECTYQDPTQIWGQFWQTAVGVTGNKKKKKTLTKRKKHRLWI